MYKQLVDDTGFDDEETSLDPLVVIRGFIDSKSFPFIKRNLIRYLLTISVSKLGPDRQRWSRRRYI